VDTFDGVLEMLKELKGATEIAIDTEHHDFRTYTGLLSLMQISTREKDWIVDTLQPWRHKLEVLNEVFADPSIIKVTRPYKSSYCGIYLLTGDRCYTVHIWISSGFREIAVSTSSVYLIHSKLPAL
jgi:hypothetical protein